MVRALKVFASHDWGEGGRNHRRVRKVVALLREHGIDVWFDETHMKGNILDAMTRGIDQADCVVVFVTCNYLAKVASGKDKDNVRREFMYAQDVRGASRMVAVRFDPSLPSRWTGPVGMVLGSDLYADLSKDPIQETGIAALANMLKQQHSQRPHRASKMRSAGAAVIFRNALKCKYADISHDSKESTDTGTGTATLGIQGQMTHLRARVKKVADALDLKDDQMHLAEILARAENTLCMQNEVKSGLFCDRLANVEAQLGL